MRNQLKFLVFLICFLNMEMVLAQNAFTKGVNLTGWFTGGNARSIPFTKFSRQDIQNIKSLGCDVIRLPIELHHFTSGAPDFVIDTLFYRYLDQVINWTEELQMNLIIDNHTIEVATSKAVEAPLLKIWPQMAQHYKSRSNLVFYEILNEPNTILAADWAAIQVKVVNAIRAVDTSHAILVSGADWGGIYGLLNLKKLSDPNLIYSFHFYDPFLFTHQGASWASPSLVDLGGVPFPYDAARIPACPASLKGSWVESSLSTAYKTDGTVARLKSTIDGVIAYAKSNNVKIFCGELGVYNFKSPVNDRVFWYQEVTGYLTAKAIPWTMWDYQGGFGLFTKGSNEMFEYDINRPMATALGFTPPLFKQYYLKPDSVPFDIYTDFAGSGIIQGGAPANGTADTFSSGAYEGNYCIYLTELAQYSNMDFDFRYNKDLSKLVAANYMLDFWVKGDTPSANVVLRFLDTKTSDPADHPWRRDYTVNTSVVPFDGKWHHVQIPLKNFRDAGAWDGSWFNAANLFDWKAVDRFQIVAENMALSGKKFWFDNLRITGTPLTGIEEEFQTGDKQACAFPNPFSGKTTIQYSLSHSASVDISIYNLEGQKIITLLNAFQTPGKHEIVWDSQSQGVSQIHRGMYLCKISSSGKSEVLKLIDQN